MEENIEGASRRNFLKAAAGTSVAALSGSAYAQSFEFKPSQRYPDPAVQILDPSFTKYRIYSSTVEQVATGMRWAEGPVYFPAGRYLLVSDIPNNRIMRFDETDNTFSLFRSPANYANGNTRDRQGRLVTCEHSVTRRITRTEHDGRITVLADNFEGRRLNAPNDIVVKSDDSIWFTDPLFGINGEWEGERAKSEQQTTNVYRLGSDGKLTAKATDIFNPNGLAFSPDEKKLYVVEWRGSPHRSVWSFEVGADGALGNKTKLIDANGPGALDGFRVDRDGNLWCGWEGEAAARRERRHPERGARRRDGLQSRRQADRLHPAARALRQSRVRRTEAQPPLHGQLPFAVRRLRRSPRRDLMS